MHLDVEIFKKHIVGLHNEYRQKHRVGSLYRTPEVSNNIYFFFVIITNIVRNCIIILNEYISRLKILYYCRFK